VLQPQQKPQDVQKNSIEQGHQATRQERLHGLYRKTRCDLHSEVEYVVLCYVYAGTVVSAKFPFKSGVRQPEGGGAHHHSRVDFN